MLPPSGPILNALARFDPLPSVARPGRARAGADARDPRQRAASGGGASVVRVVGTACGLGIEGSGWVAAPGLVVTNAHVVAGESDTDVEVGGQAARSAGAVPVVFDVHNDIAVLRVHGLDEPRCRSRPIPSPGTAAAILGYPLDGPFDVQPARLGQTQLTSTEDAYGNGPVLRMISALRGLVRPGNSGGPMIDARRSGGRDGVRGDHRRAGRRSRRVRGARTRSWPGEIARARRAGRSAPVSARADILRRRPSTLMRLACSHPLRSASSCQRLL